MDIALARSERAGTSAKSCAYYDHRGNENKKSTRDVLGSANTWNSGGVCSVDGSIPPMRITFEKPRNRA